MKTTFQNPCNYCYDIVMERISYLKQRAIYSIYIERERDWKRISIQSDIQLGKKWRICLKPGSHYRHQAQVLAQDQYDNKSWVLLWDLWGEKKENFSLFRLLFCSWLMLGLCSYAYAYSYDEPYVAGLTSFQGLAFVLHLWLCLCR